MSRVSGKVPSLRSNDFQIAQRSIVRRTVVTSAAELREQAERCRRLAASTAEQTFARVLIGLADEYMERAKRLEQQAAALSQSPPLVPQQQPMQQQQQVQPRKKDR